MIPTFFQVQKRCRQNLHYALISKHYILLVQRSENVWALPGGKVEYMEDTKTAAVRELKEETDVDVSQDSISFIMLCDNPYRDHRYHMVSVVYLLKDDTYVDMYPKADWFSLYSLPTLAFDHESITVI